tara:strand:- start:1425 stop:2876 length:1452 start_codon:yes stop_codon:yes gene_type:complete
VARGDFKQRVVLELEDKASAGVKRTQGAFSRLGSFLSSKFVITLGDVVQLFKGITSGMVSFVTAAGEQEAVVKRLDQALSGLGPAAAEVSEKLQEQAAALEATTKFSDEAIISNQALAVNLGVSAKDMERLTAASVELSSATGRSLESSFVNLARTMNGFRGELGELVPEIATMSEESLRAGDALTVVLDRLGGTAAAEAQTFTGVLTSLGNAWGTIKEQIGAAVTQNEGFRKALAQLQETLTSKGFSEGLASFVEALGKMITFTVELGAKLPEVTSKLADYMRGYIVLAKAVWDAIEPIREFVAWIVNATAKVIAFLSPIARLVSLVTELGAETKKAADIEREMVEEQEKRSATTQKQTVVTKQLVQTIKEEAEETEEATEAVKEHTEALEKQGVAAAGAYGEAVAKLTAEVERLKQQLGLATEEAKVLNAETGGALTGLRARDPRHQADVDAALLAGRVPNRGGTRIATADGSGSRLLQVP